jgi:folate-dependent phosphoribosylglycinamide formyltransferase PurN
MKLDLTPNEYMATSRDLYETARSYQVAREQGIAAAHADHRKHKERMQKEQAAVEKLKKQAGG